MFDNLGVQWAGTLLGCLSLIMIPIPFGFIVFGSRLRGLSRYQAPQKILSQDTASNDENTKEEV
jgi:DHA1 family multidrug resistance protein-like MFS transporter